MEWKIHGRRALYESWFVALDLVKVELPSGRVFEHEVVRVPRHSATVAAVDPDRGVLMIYRHRFITDRWGWEMPGGMVEPREDPETAARRECLEETGWSVDVVRQLTSMHPASGLSDQCFHLFLAEGASHVGPPTDPDEASKIAWRSFDEIEQDLVDGAIPDGLMQLGLTLVLGAVGRPVNRLERPITYKW